MLGLSEFQNLQCDCIYEWVKKIDGVSDFQNDDFDKSAVPYYDSETEKELKNAPLSGAERERLAIYRQ